MMRDEILKARLKEDLRRAMLTRRDAAENLIRHNDAVLVLDSRGLATQQDRVGLATAQEDYEHATISVNYINRRLRGDIYIRQ